MTKQQIFKEAHRIAGYNKKCGGYTRDLSYSQNLSLALKKVYAKAKAEKETLAKAAKFGNIDKYMVNALEAIQNGGSWNGKVYNNRVGSSYAEVSVYVNNKKYAFGKTSTKAAAEEVAMFEKAAKELNVKVVTSSSNYSKKGLTYGEAYHRYGFDFAEEGEY